MKTRRLIKLQRSAKNAVAAQLPLKARYRKPGIYFGLDEDHYRADAALDAIDLRRLAYNPRLFWWESRFNPIKGDKEKTSEVPAEKVISRAMHAAILEGRDSLLSRYAPVYFDRNTKSGRAERVKIAEDGKEPIEAKHWEMIALASEIIRADPVYGELFRETIATEVSIFWECKRTGMRRKARIDAFKAQLILDLEIINNDNGAPFEQLCRKHIASNGCHMRADNCHEAVAQIGELVKADAVFGMFDKATIEKFKTVVLYPLVAFVFVCVQRSGGPLVYGTTISPENDIFNLAQIDFLRAERNWHANLKRFGGINRPWIIPEPLAELDLAEISTGALCSI